MPDIPILIAVGAAFWLVASSPGPANLSNAAIAMRYGRGPSVIYGLGLSVALAFWGILAATGMGAILQASATALLVLKLLGGLYLLSLAWSSARSAANSEQTEPKAIPAGCWFWRGIALNLSNPKSVIAWMAALSVGLDPSAGVWSVVLTTSVCVVVAFFNNLTYSLVFSMGGMMAVYRRFRRWVDGVTAVLFSLAGFALIRSAFTR
ncbi:LysE family translocator [Pseudohalocynthiibacter aestuariivivens]|nr:LysE family translocator [Pseudohalocynthiibacter aestuariivivens]QIE46963.1 LysE family translocator [Pseudohalocynthiibacter aestuariivivens]